MKNKTKDTIPYVLGSAAALAAGLGVGYADYQHMAKTGHNVVGFYVAVSSLTATVVAGLLGTEACFYVSDLLYRRKKSIQGKSV